MIEFCDRLKEAMNSTDISVNDAINILVHNETTAILTLISSIFFAVMPVLSSLLR